MTKYFEKRMCDAPFCLGVGDCSHCTNNGFTKGNDITTTIKPMLDDVDKLSIMTGYSRVRVMKIILKNVIEEK